jgi:uncharacterized RDD family membrane protein YckC
MKQTFTTSVGTVEILLDEQSRIISVYRFDAAGRPNAASIESWDHTDLGDLLVRQAGVPAHEACEIGSALREVWGRRLGSAPAGPEPAPFPRTRDWALGQLEGAGLGLRFVAVLLDALIVFFPLGIIVGLLSGGGYSESGPGYANAGIDIGGKAFFLLLVLGLGYYIFCESLTGATLGKRMVGIRVVGEDGTEVSFGAAVVRNLLRIVDAFFFYLVGAIFALTSPRGQRLGDRAAHTVVVRA